MTNSLLMACGGRLPASTGWLRDAVAHYIADETGHDEWILSDIAACGADAQAIRDGEPGFDTEVMIRFAYHQIDRGNPIGFFGMVHVLEGTSTAIATAAAEAIRTTLKLPQTAFTYLTSHGALDQDHMRFFAGLVNDLSDPADKEAIIAMARDMFALFGGVFAGIQLETLNEAA